MSGLIHSYQRRRDFVRSTIDRLGAADGSYSFTYRECGRLHRTLGRCSVLFDPTTGKPKRVEVSLAKRFIGCAGFDLRGTLLHESAHVIQAYHFGRNVFRSRGHGREWRSIMIELGAEPNVTHPFTVAMALKLPKNKLGMALRMAPDLDYDKALAAYRAGVPFESFVEGCRLGHFTLKGAE